MNLDENLAVTIGGGFFGGLLIGFALKKVVKILAIVVGLFFAGLAYLQYQHIVNIDWSKLQETSQNTVQLFQMQQPKFLTTLPMSQIAIIIQLPH